MATENDFAQLSLNEMTEELIQEMLSTQDKFDIFIADKRLSEDDVETYSKFVERHMDFINEFIVESADPDDVCEYDEADEADEADDDDDDVELCNSCLRQNHPFACSECGDYICCDCEDIHVCES